MKGGKGKKKQIERMERTFKDKSNSSQHNYELVNNKLYHLFLSVDVCICINQYTHNVHMSTEGSCHQWSHPILYEQ